MAYQFSDSQKLEAIIKIKDIIKIPISNIELNNEHIEIYSNGESVGIINYSQSDDGNITYGEYEINWEQVYRSDEQKLSYEIFIYCCEPIFEITVSDEFRHLWVTVKKKDTPKLIRLDYDVSWKIIEVK